MSHFLSALALYGLDARVHHQSINREELSKYCEIINNNFYIKYIYRKFLDYPSSKNNKILTQRKSEIFLSVDEFLL